MPPAASPTAWSTPSVSAPARSASSSSPISPGLELRVPKPHWKRLAATLRAEGLSDRQARLACALVLARMLHASSEREAHAWLSARSAASELLGLDRNQPFSLSQLYPSSTDDRHIVGADRLGRCLFSTT